MCPVESRISRHLTCFQLRHVRPLENLPYLRRKLLNAFVPSVILKNVVICLSYNRCAFVFVVQVVEELIIEVIEVWIEHDAVDPIIE